jgi:hypothetical protein
MRRIATAMLFILFAPSVYAQKPAVTLVFVKIQDQIIPLQRESKYEIPLSTALRNAKVGEVTGGGTMMNKEKSIVWVGVDVYLSDLDTGLPFLVAKLRELGVPPGSTIEYTLHGKKIQQSVH